MRITSQHLTSAVARINRLLNAPVEMFAIEWNGPGVANGTKWAVGHYHIESQGFNHKLVKTTSESGCTTDVLIAKTKGELFELLHAYISGITVARH